MTPRQPPGAVGRGGLKGSAGRPCGKSPLGGTSGGGTLSPGTAKPEPGPCCPPRRCARRGVRSQRLCRHGFAPRGRHGTALGRRHPAGPPQKATPRPLGATAATSTGTPAPRSAHTAGMVHTGNTKTAAASPKGRAQGNGLSGTATRVAEGTSCEHWGMRTPGKCCRTMEAPHGSRRSDGCWFCTYLATWRVLLGTNLTLFHMLELLYRSIPE